MTFDETDEEKERLKDLKKEYEDFTKWYKDLLAGKVDRVNVSHRRSSQPALLLSGQYGVSANMMRILKAQALARDKDYEFSLPRLLLCRRLVSHFSFCVCCLVCTMVARSWRSTPLTQSSRT